MFFLEEGDIMTVRKNISSDDLAVLEQYYGESPYPKRDVLEKTANELDYDIERVRVRNKWECLIVFLYSITVLSFSFH